MKKQENRGGQNATVKSNPFDLKNSDSRYWIGMIASDGNVSSNTNRVSLCLKDIKHVEKYAIHTKCNTHFDKNKKMLNAYFGNTETKEFLISLGITPRKSRTFAYKDVIDSDFLRGYFDGDGCPGTFTEKTKCLQPKITTGSTFFKEQLCSFFHEQGWTYSVHEKSLNCYDVYLRGDSRFSFFEFLYTDCKTYLGRKYKVYRGLLEKSRWNNPVNSEKIHMWDNSEPSFSNSIKVEKKVQRLTVEELIQ